MIEPGTLRGARALVKAGYHTAAEITGYSLGRSPLGEAWLVSGTVVSSDPFLLTQGALEFVTPHKSGAWRWPVASWQISGRTFSACLGGQR